MEARTIISLVEHQTLGRRLSSVEHWVFEQSWHGKSYIHMAQQSSYSSGYLKVVGAKLWTDLSTAMRTTITKKNLRWVLHAHLEGKRDDSPASLGEPTKSQPCSSESLPPAASQETKPTTGTLPSHSNPPPLAPSIQNDFIPFPSGPVALDSPLYIQRGIERQTYGELQTPGCLLRLHGPSRNGKTSLLLRLLHQAKDWNYAVIFIDFQTVERSILSDLDSFLRWLCANIIRQISSQTSRALLSGIDAFWDDSLGAGINCTDCLEQMVLDVLDTPIVLALNEVNQAMSQPELLQDFLSLLRFWHEQSKHQDLWKKLRLILVYSTECYVPLRIDRSPFNVGFAVKLPPFTLAEVQVLAIRHGFDWAQGEAGQAELEPLLRLTGGNPYLVRLAFHATHESSDDLADVLGKALLPEGPYFPHLRERAQFLQEEPDLARALSVIFTREGIEQLHPRELYHLENAGFIRYRGKQVLPSCELYHQFFQDLLSSSDAFTPNPDSSDNPSPKHTPTDFQQPPKQHHVS